LYLYNVVFKNVLTGVLILKNSFIMTKLIENQIDENQMIEKELEELYGGGGSALSCPNMTSCSYTQNADEDGQGNVLF